jgi:cellulose synthase/poly-beta-1,6-N-acetylglucosamine synthase-like glycosyltransferase
MIDLILVITLISIAIPIYVYVGYPALLFLLNKLMPQKQVNKADITPNVAMFVSCYNEEAVIEDKIKDCLALDYPKDKIEFIFISDGSEDETDNIIKRYADQGIKLVRQEGRLGKTSGLNLGMQETQSEIIVFSDANAMYDTQAIRQLVRNFNDPQVGYVVGAALYTDGNDNAAAGSENAYWEYEMALKKMETNLHSVVGGDGAIYAIRRKLFITLEREDINDFVNPLQIIDQGYRGIFEPEAKCFEETAGNFEKEGNRKERIVNRSFRGLMKVKAVMNPFKTGFFALEVISHKLLRWLIPVFFFTAALGSIILSLADVYTFHFITILGIAFLWLALTGFFKAQKDPSGNTIKAVFYYPYYFMLVNIRSLFGIIAALKGNIQVTWSSPRADQDGNSISKNTAIASFCFIIVSALILTNAFYNI